MGLRTQDSGWHIACKPLSGDSGMGLRAQDQNSGWRIARRRLPRDSGMGLRGVWGMQPC